MCNIISKSEAALTLKKLSEPHIKVLQGNFESTEDYFKAFEAFEIYKKFYDQFMMEEK